MRQPTRSRVQERMKELLYVCMLSRSCTFSDCLTYTPSPPPSFLFVFCRFSRFYIQIKFMSHYRFQDVGYPEHIHFVFFLLSNLRSTCCRRCHLSSTPSPFHSYEQIFGSTNFFWSQFFMPSISELQT